MELGRVRQVYGRTMFCTVWIFVIYSARMRLGAGIRLAAAWSSWTARPARPADTTSVLGKASNDDNKQIKTRM